jgi:hypothetical protein
MDRIELQTLADEIGRDVEVAGDALRTAEERFADRTPMALESCAFHLTRCYNVIEQMALRVAKAFENSIDDEKGWHTGLIRRLSIRIQGVRPPLFAEDIRQPLQELKDFRHVVVHAYELELDPEKLALILKYARLVTDRLPALVREFIETVAREQSIES